MPSLNVIFECQQLCFVMTETKPLCWLIIDRMPWIGHPATDRECMHEQMQDKALQGRLFYKQSFSIYGGVGGLYDYGPPGTAVKANITQFWRQHFVFSESMLELECPAVTPEPVLKASGHVDRFVDYMVRDEQQNCFRADHLLEDKLEQIIADPKASAEARKVCYTAVVAF
jgi:glycyl-tRNA synthetase (class II)